MTLPLSAHSASAIVLRRSVGPGLSVALLAIFFFALPPTTLRQLRHAPTLVSGSISDQAARIFVAHEGAPCRRLPKAHDALNLKGATSPSYCQHQNG